VEACSCRHMQHTAHSECNQHSSIEQCRLTQQQQPLCNRQHCQALACVEQQGGGGERWERGVALF
jgi:hypothetical protein